MLLAVIESLLVPAIWSDMASFIPFENRPFEGLGEGVTIGVLITYAIIIIVLALHISYYFKKWIGYVATIAVSLLFCITLATDDLHTFVERMQKYHVWLIIKTGVGFFQKFHMKTIGAIKHICAIPCLPKVRSAHFRII